MQIVEMGYAELESSQCMQYLVTYDEIIQHTTVQEPAFEIDQEYLFAYHNALVLVDKGYDNIPSRLVKSDHVPSWHEQVFFRLLKPSDDSGEVVLRMHQVYILSKIIEKTPRANGARRNGDTARYMSGLVNVFKWLMDDRDPALVIDEDAYAQMEETNSYWDKFLQVLDGDIVILKF